MKRALLLLALLASAVALAGYEVPISVVQRFRAGLKIGGTGSLISDSYSASATVDFASTTVGVVESSAITVTGAEVGDDCIVGVPTAAGALKARYECYVSAADAVKIKFTPLAETMGTTAAFDGASPATATATVTASSVCTCSMVGTTAAIAAGGCAVSLSSTTLTMTTVNGSTETANYYCRAPVDPASGTYTVRVIDP